MSEPAASSPPPRWLLWARLFRLPNVFSAFADIFLGCAVAAAFGQSVSVIDLLFLLVSSGALYISGMVWNDLFDLEVDRQERPQRPLPSGSISVRAALRTATALMLLGVTAAACVNGSALVIAGALCACIFAYDGLLKKTLVAPLAMGGCRLLNVALGIAGVWGNAASLAEMPLVLWLAPLANGIYITGVTWFARQEATTSSRPLLVFATVVLLGGLGLHGYIMATYTDQPLAWIAGAAFVAVVGYRIVSALRDPSPGPVQTAIKTFVLGLVALDAVVTAAFTHPLFGLGVLLLLVPAFLLGRRIYST